MLFGSVRSRILSLRVPWYGKFLYCVFPVRRRIVLKNMRRVFGNVLGEPEIQRLAHAFYAHFAKLVGEFLLFPVVSRSKSGVKVAVENLEFAEKAHALGKGILMLTCHMGSWEVALVSALQTFPQHKGLFYFVRRALKPRWFDSLVTGRFRRNGFGTIAKDGSLDEILNLLAGERIVVFVMDQHAWGRGSVRSEFFGEAAGTFKSLAVMAMATGAPVVPAYTWREPDGTHVFRFEDPIELADCEDTNEAIRRNTRRYNEVIEKIVLRHPEQWFWMHRRWKLTR